MIWFLLAAIGLFSGGEASSSEASPPPPRAPPPLPPPPPRSEVGRLYPWEDVLGALGKSRTDPPAGYEQQIGLYTAQVRRVSYYGSSSCAQAEVAGPGGVFVRGKIRCWETGMSELQAIQIVGEDAIAERRKILEE